MATPMVGKRLIEHLENIGVTSLKQLSAMDEGMLARLIAFHTGLAGWETHSMARMAVRNAIGAAKEHHGG